MNKNSEKESEKIANQYLPNKMEYKNGEFEFLILGELEFSDNWEKILTPNSFKTEKVIKDKWPYFVVDNDEFSYSFEEVGIQMTFNPEMKFEKAKKIADEIIENIKNDGQNAELQILDSGKIYKF